MTSYLTFDEVKELRTAATDSGLMIRPRMLLFRDIRQSFVNTLMLDPSPDTQFSLDITRLNSVPRLEDGSVPLTLYLRNGADLIRDLPEARVFQKYTSVVTNRASGLGPLVPLTVLPANVIAREVIIHQDDTVDIGFLESCLSAGKAVAKLDVPRFENGVRQTLNTGAPWIANGTGWLMAPDVLITNHHVINAREDNEGDAAPADFERQALETHAFFDFDSATANTVSAKVKKVEAADATLDFCVLRLSAPLPRAALPLLDQTVSVNAATYLPLNVIQHPQGKAKRFALRNNLAVDATGDVVRYYTDTDAGSSGSPVLDDRWRVVALHRGAMLQQAKFQGKDTAFVNVGSQIAQILVKLRQLSPLLCTELGV